MAAASAAAMVVPLEPMPAVAGGAGGVAEGASPMAPQQHQQQQRQQHHPHPPPPQMQHWFVDERDEFISWLRCEFAAANAVIDLLLHHLRTVGDPGEYDHVAAAIHQRRTHWTPVLHMQQYFPISDVSFAFHQSSWGRQQRQLRQAQTQPLQQHRHFDGPPTPAKDGRKPGFGHKHGRTVRGNHGFCERNGEKAEDKIAHKVEEDVRQRGIPHVAQEKGLGSCDAPASKDGYSSKGGEAARDEKCPQESPGNCKESVLKECVNATLDQHGKDKISHTPRVFSAMETYDGKKVNIVEGLRLYEELFDDKEITELTLLANKMRASGHKGELQGQTFLILRRPVKGHGREVIQLGIPITEATSHEVQSMTQSAERSVEAIPSILHDVLDKLVQMQVLAVKPDFCVIDFFNEGDHSHPHIWPPWYGRPVCNLFLTHCDIVYGRVVGVDQKGDYNGSLKVSLNAGSLLVMKGKSADFAKRAIPSLGRQRVILTFGKSRLKKDHLLDGLSLSSSAAHAPGPWVSSSVREAENFSGHSPGPKHYGVIPTSAVRAAPAVHPNGIQPLFLAAHVSPAALPFSAASVPLPPSTTGWTVPASAHQSAPVPGTGVFIPPGSVPSIPSQQMQVALSSAETICALATNFSSENGSNGVVNSNTNKNVAPRNYTKENAGTSEHKFESTENLTDVDVTDKDEEVKVQRT